MQLAVQGDQVVGLFIFQILRTGKFRATCDFRGKELPQILKEAMLNKRGRMNSGVTEYLLIFICS